MATSKDPLVLSIQSQVVHGRSGNRSAVFALEINGVNCDPLNTVQLSANTAYPHKRGTTMDIDQFREVIEGLRLNSIIPMITHLLTGYIADPKIIEELVSFRRGLSPDVHFFCDPVLGDLGKLYLSSECFEMMKKVLVPTATTICPNAYEAMWLTDMPLSNQQELIDAVAQLHEIGPKNVIISSTEWKRRCVFFSFENGKEQFAIMTPSFPRKFDGPGDLFSALLLANMIKYPGEFRKIGQLTVNTVYAVLKKTFNENARELTLTKCVDEFLNPPDIFTPISVDELMKQNIDDPYVI